jgi:hypothetical protein
MFMLLAGCAAAPRSAFPPIANMHSPTLCYVEYAGNALEASAARAELGKRGFICTVEALAEGRQQFATMQANQQQLDMQQRQDQARRGDAAVGLGILLLSTPPPPMARPPVVCNTYGHTTVCN